MSSIGSSGASTPTQYNQIEEKHGSPVAEHTDVNAAEAAAGMEAERGVTGLVVPDSVARDGRSVLDGNAPPPSVDGSRSSDGSVMDFSAWSASVCSGGGDISKIESDAAKAKIEDIKTKFAVKKANIGALQAAIEVTGKAIKELYAQIGGLRDGLSNPDLDDKAKGRLQDQVATILDKIEDMKDKMSKQRQTLDELRNDCSLMKTGMSALDSFFKSKLKEAQDDPKKSPTDVNRVQELQKQAQQTNASMLLPAELQKEYTDKTDKDESGISVGGAGVNT